MWPANFILQGMARHKHWQCSHPSGLINWRYPLHCQTPGLDWCCPELNPTTLECLLFVIPYSMRVIGIDLRTALKEIFLPSASSIVMVSS
jgi:hypothetical protein